MRLISLTRKRPDHTGNQPGRATSPAAACAPMESKPLRCTLPYRTTP